MRGASPLEAQVLSFLSSFPKPRTTVSEMSGHRVGEMTWGWDLGFSLWSELV